MPKDLINDPEYLRANQYGQPDNLRARINLHQRFSTNPADWHQWVFNHYDFDVDARILEIGCGPGDTWAHNQKHVPNTWQLTLTDLSQGMVSNARQNLSALSVQVCCVNADLIPFPTNSFDGVIGNHMLYHVPDLDRTLVEIQRVLTPTGQLITATNGSQHLKELNEIINGFDPSYKVENQTRPFELENGEQLLSKYFQEVERTEFPDGLRVTEVEPLVDFTLSLWSINQEFFDEQLEAYRRYLQQMIDDDGCIEIRKSTGVFVSRSPKSS
ncbi:MAG: class I SAM-dependent methyltransferase [Chloroflexota bacterium]